MNDIASIPADAALKKPDDPKEHRAVSHLINRTAVRDLALLYSRQMRNGRFTRVSENFLDGIEDLVRASVASRVHRAPSVGKTL